MKALSFPSRIAVGALLGTVLLSPALHATLLLDITTALSASDPTQLGRLSRNGILSDWSSNKAFPGVIDPTGLYHYHTWLLTPGLTPFIQVSIDDPVGVVFASAYLDSYNPNPTAVNRGLDVNYLGDAGFSGNDFGNPGFFQVVVPAGHNLVLVLNDPNASNGGLNTNFGLMVEGFIDNQFNEPIATPEPSSMLLAGAAFALLATWRFRRRACV